MNKVKEFFNRNWVIMALVLVCVFISIKCYQNGVAVGSWKVCEDNGGILLSTGECINLDVSAKGYRICKDVDFQTDNDFVLEGLNVSV